MVNIICLLGPVNAAVHGVHIETFFFIILYSCYGGGYCYYLCDRLICDHWPIRTCCTIDMKCEQIEIDSARGIVFFFTLWENIVVISKDGEGASGECLHFRQNGNLLIGRVRNPSWGGAAPAPVQYYFVYSRNIDFLLNFLSCFHIAIQMTDWLINYDLSYSTMNSVTPTILRKKKFPKIIINKKKMSCIMEMEITCLTAKVEFAAGK